MIILPVSPCGDNAIRAVYFALTMFLVVFKVPLVEGVFRLGVQLAKAAFHA